MTDILMLVCTTVFIFIVEQICLAIWNKIKSQRKIQKSRRKK